MEKLNLKLDKNIIVLFISAVLLLIIVIIVLFSFSAPPKNVRNEIYKLSIQALDVCDDYLDMKITSSEANSKIENIRKRFNEFGGCNGTDEKIIDDCLFILTLNLNESTEKRYEKVLKQRNDLAKCLNKSTRRK